MAEWLQRSPRKRKFRSSNPDLVGFSIASTIYTRTQGVIPWVDLSFEKAKEWKELPPPHTLIFAVGPG